MASRLLLCGLFWIVAAAGFSGFVGKWGLRDGDRQFGVEAMLDGTGHKPFVYRRLAPMIANLADQLAGDSIKEYLSQKIRPEATFTRIASATDPHLRFRYLVIYYLSFGSLFLSLFVLRLILLDVGAGKVSSLLAPISFVLAFPYLQTVAGYFYDHLELLFLSIAFLCAYRGGSWLLIALVVPATLNKESFLFFLPALYPPLRVHCSARSAVAVTSVAVFVAGMVNVLVKLLYLDAPGSPVVFQLPNNVSDYLTPWLYGRLENTYGIAGPASANLATLAAAAIIALRGWPGCSLVVRRHLLIAAAINLSLLLAFCAAGEMRNLSFLFVGFVILLAAAIDGADRRIGRDGQ